MTTSTTDAVRYEKSDGIVNLTIDDPYQSANTMNQAYRDSMEAAVNQLVDEIAADADSIKGVIVSSGKKTFFAGGDLKLMTQATPADAEEIFEKSSRSRPRCASSRPAASPSSRPSTAPRSAAASRSRSPATTASRRTAATRSACPRSPSACCPAAAASPARSGCSASRTR